MNKRLFTLLFLVVFLLSVTTANAQMIRQITVCRDPAYGWVRLQFRNIPTWWFTSNGMSWGYYAEGVSMDAANGVMYADALTVETNGYPAGTVVLYQRRYSVIGNANSPKCPKFVPIMQPRKH